MTDEWYWCLTHSRPEPATERDDPDNALGPYATESAARDWKALRDQREEAWKDDEDEDDDG